MSYHRQQPSHPEFPEFPDQRSRLGHQGEPGRSDRDGGPGHPAYSWQHPAQPTGPRKEIRALGSAYRRLRRVSTFTALGYFVLFLLLSAYAPELMSGTVAGGLTTGLLLGLIQLPVTLIAVLAYERSARRNVDPLAESVRLHGTRADAPAHARGDLR
ncbi:DUF485 domain-containing protein [Streptomyces sp. NPDC004726]